MRLLAVVCFRDEEEILPATLASIGAQTRAADLLVLLDDGSDDRSPEVAEAFAAGNPNARMLRRLGRSPEPDRLAWASVVRAFEWALEQVDEPWDVAAKLDGDIRLSPQTFEAVLERFEQDPCLGMAGPRLAEVGRGGIVALTSSRPEHVEGGTKFYRRACYEQIAPLPNFLGWDTIDEIRARLRGWRTESFPIPSGNAVHLRPMGSVDGMVRAYRRWGRGAWAFGEHPLHVVLLGLRGMGRPPRIRGGLAYMWGWAEAALQHAPRAEREVLEWTRRDQLRRIALRLRRFGRRAPAATAS